jgi:hypothetical protein
VVDTAIRATVTPSVIVAGEVGLHALVRICKRREQPRV